MKRRTFLKLAGAGSLSIAAGCTSKPDKTLFSLVQAPDDMVTGKPSWYASTCRECPAGCGILTKNREGRIIKIEGNPLHPINRGKLCMRGQAALQGIYNPDRLKTPLLREKGQWRPITFARAHQILREKGEMAAQGAGINRVRMMTEVVGDSLHDLQRTVLKQWWSDKPLIFEPFAYESLKTANHEIFNFSGLPSYHMDQADCLISFGADFLETWLSPVEYTRKLKMMQSPKNGGRGAFVQVSPYQSLTGANADLWLSCAPGGEAAIALGLARQLLDRGLGKALPQPVRASIKRIMTAYTSDSVIRQSGISSSGFRRLLALVSRARKPLILGTGSGPSGINSLQTNMGANLLNLILDPQLSLLDFSRRHRVEMASSRSDTVKFIKKLNEKPADLMLLNNVNPAFVLSPETGIAETLKRDSLFVVDFTSFMDETAELSNLVFPVQLPLETWDEYSGKNGITSTQQPTMGNLTNAPHIGDVLLSTAFKQGRPAEDFKTYLFDRLRDRQNIRSRTRRVDAFRRGGKFGGTRQPVPKWHLSHKITDVLHAISEPPASRLVFMAVPSIRFFDGRGANKPWLCEIPDPLTKVAWQTPVLVHPKTLRERQLSQGEVIQIQSKGRKLEAPVVATECVRPGVLVMNLGQGHTAYGRYAKDMGINPTRLLPPDLEHVSGAPCHVVYPISIQTTGKAIDLAHTDGDRFQHGRKIALTMNARDTNREEPHGAVGLTMEDFPLVLPLAEGYDEKRDMYPPHSHDTYRWAMAIDLDKCIGCNACSVACYAENNIGTVGLERILEQREMSWLQIQRYHVTDHPERITFFPMLCQHCDNAPCESVCPVYAPHHSKEGLNNQVYNRCIGTRFCSQNCPYKVRRFNWFDWDRPEPMNLQLNPDVTVRSKGVTEKCSFCIQRIKAAHTDAKNENREIRDGEVVPACAQTCPTDAFTFGNILDPESRIRKMAETPRAYQAMGYLNTKPAVIYLKKVIQEI